MSRGAKFAARTTLQGSPEPIAALNRVRIQEESRPWFEREPLVDIRRHCPEVICSDTLCPFLRLRTATMLNQAQSALPKDRQLKVATALRTLAMQKSGWDNYLKRMQEEHPTWPLSALRRATNKYHAPYDQKAPPGHCTGGAVDVILVDSNNEPVDVTSPTQGWEAAYTWSDKLSPEARSNRMVMVEAMLSAGFSNCRDEYWHYSWGDSAWAVRVGEYECPYGWAHPPVCLEGDFPQAFVADTTMETARRLDGRPLHASGGCRVPTDATLVPDGQPSLCAGLYWARDLTVTLRVLWPSVPVNAALFIGPSLDCLEPVIDVVRDGDALLARVTPVADRTFITNYSGLKGTSLQ